MISDILILYEEELLADGMQRIINEIEPSAKVEKHLLYDDLEKSIGTENYDMVIISKDKNLNISFVCPTIKAKNEECKIVFMSSAFSSEDVKKFMEHNVNAMICKKYSIAKIKSIMGLVLMGENYYPPELLPYTNKAFLSNQQLKIVKFLRQGYSNKQIAYDLGITEATVKAHMTLIMRKFNVVNRIQVIQKALSMGLLEY